MIFIGCFTIPFLFYPLFKLMDNGRKQLKEEMALILGLPIMRRESRINHRDDNYDDYVWNYGGMNNSFKSYLSTKYNIQLIGNHLV